MRHQYVIVGLLSVICGLLGYIAAQVTSKPETFATSVPQQVVSNKATTVTPPSANSEYAEGGEIVMPITHYPQQAKEEAIEGTAKIKVFTDENGKVTKARVTESSGEAVLDQNSLREAKKLTYQPKIINGQAVKTRYIAVYNYQLND